MATRQAMVSVVVPTYNRCDILRHTLASLAAQRFARDRFEVIVSDDGSSDATADVVRSFSGRLRLRYHFQDDLGFRAAAARNAGARLATAPVLVFLDTGTVAGPDFVRAHLEAHTSSATSRAVIGYTYGYRPHEPISGLAEALDTLTPERIVERYQHNPSFRDWRHDVLEDAAFDMGRRRVPWLLFWATNISVRAEAFWAVGGFDEDFRSWGAEDLEFGYRLSGRGASFVFSREAWGLEMPHERDIPANDESNLRNVLMFLGKHRHPVVELTWAVFKRGELWPVETQYRALLEWTREARGLDVASEIEEAVTGWHGTPARVAVIGCGARVPPRLRPGSVLVDFDRGLLDIATADQRHEGHHAIGLRTALPDRSVDLVVITTRLRRLMDTWRPELTAEADRIGGAVVLPPAA